MNTFAANSQATTDGSVSMRKTDIANALAALIVTARAAGNRTDVEFIQALCIALGIDVRYVADLVKQVQP